MFCRLLRDLSGGDSAAASASAAAPPPAYGDLFSLPCEVSEPTVTLGGEGVDQQLQSRLRMRKLRAGLNMLTARLGSAAEEGGDCYERELREVGKWVAVLKTGADETAFK